MPGYRARQQSGADSGLATSPEDDLRGSQVLPPHPPAKSRRYRRRREEGVRSSLSNMPRLSL